MLLSIKVGRKAMVFSSCEENLLATLLMYRLTVLQEVVDNSLHQMACVHYLFKEGSPCMA